MGRFQSEFDTHMDHTLVKTLHSELWDMYRERVDALVRGGEDRLAAERLAIPLTEKDFARRHPELRQEQWAIRVVQP